MHCDHTTNIYTTLFTLLQILPGDRKEHPYALRITAEHHVSLLKEIVANQKRELTNSNRREQRAQENILKLTTLLAEKQKLSADMRKKMEKTKGLPSGFNTIV